MKFFLLNVIIFLNILILRSQTNLMNVKPWAYQLQNVDISSISSDKGIKLIVSDYSTDGTDKNKFTKQQISDIKNSGKYAISYISIGEAEDYRYYWKQEWKTIAPEWLGPVNPRWPGNYKVKFWIKEWQDIIFNYIDTIVSQGFDGIYLDIIDAWYYWAVENPQKADADSLMCGFVINIRNHVNTITGNQNFIIIPQNAEDVIYQQNVSDELRTEYFNAINAIGLEDVFFPGENDENNNYNPDEYRLEIIKNYLNNNKQAYSIEYLTEQSKVSQYQQAAAEKMIVPYSCIRALNKMCPPLISGIEEKNNYQEIILPNPFSESATINYELRTADRVIIDIFNALGEKITTLVDEYQEAGAHTARFNADEYPGGLYIFRLQTGSEVHTGKLLKVE